MRHTVYTDVVKWRVEVSNPFCQSRIYRTKSDYLNLFKSLIRSSNIKPVRNDDNNNKKEVTTDFYLKNTD